MSWGLTPPRGRECEAYGVKGIARPKPLLARGDLGVRVLRGAPSAGCGCEKVGDMRSGIDAAAAAAAADGGCGGGGGGAAGPGGIAEGKYDDEEPGGPGIAAAWPWNTKG